MSERPFDELRHVHRTPTQLRMDMARATKVVQTVTEGYYEAWGIDARDAADAELARAEQAIAELRRKLAYPVKPELQGQCLAPMHHVNSGEDWPCILPAIHRLFDGEDERHLDQHGHHAEPVVHAATIREVQRVQDARDRGEIT
jgi:hypothetical protein